LREGLDGAHEGLLIAAGKHFELLQLAQKPSVFNRCVFCFLQAEELIRGNIQDFSQLDNQFAVQPSSRRFSQ
jgi:hypothetical protein